MAAKVRTSVNKLYQRVLGLIRMLWREVAKFGVVGAVAWVIDSAIFLYLMNGPLHQGEVWAKGWATVVAALFSWAANRWWTFRHRKQANAGREALLFFLMNAIGLLIAAGCVAFTKYVLNMNSQAAIFIAGSVVGLVLGTIFRYFAYRFWVFNEALDQEPEFAGDHELLHSQVAAGAMTQAEAHALAVAANLEGAAGFDPALPMEEEALDAEVAREENHAKDPSQG
ncbi:GtrA family protein [Galactobacter caseinivorans]|uniref:GtrA family protein n=1 Tax=Galactobacter caseinivorans TaxID=2676123 RepID=A0A496PJF4_9MICC|nr:GtrA family protein [Galactobacter caseinivorans]RKW70633.1 GtrA family protein [Galactobacter caseinivorans]